MLRLKLWVYNPDCVGFRAIVIAAIVISVIFYNALFSYGDGDVSEYVIGSGDTVQISVWEHPQFNCTAPVGPDGKITISLLGDIPVAGFTREQVKKDITERLYTYIREGAEVTVSVVEFNSRKISVLGEVKTPRTITFSDMPSLMEVIMVHAVPTPDADLTAVKIMPSDSGRKPVIVNVAEALQAGKISSLPELHQGDTVYVPRREITPEEKSVVETAGSPTIEYKPAELPEITAVKPREEEFVVHIMGAVGRPSSYVFTGSPTLMEALLQAGGVSDSMALKYIRIIRNKSDNGRKVLDVDLDKYLANGDAALIPRLYSGDTVYVPDLSQEKMKDVSIIITGEVLRPGNYRTRESLNILDAISLAGGLTENADAERIRVRRELADSYQEKVVNIDGFLRNAGSVSQEMVEPGYRIYVPRKQGTVSALGNVGRGLIAFVADLTIVYGFYRLVTD